MRRETTSAFGKRSPLIAMLLCGALLAAACVKSPPSSTLPTDTPISTGPSPTQHKGGKFPIGSLVLDSGSGSTCPAGTACQIQFQVTCPAVQEPARGVFLIQTSLGSARGMVVFFLGGLGTGEGGEKINRDLIRSIALQGIESVVVQWTDSWMAAASGEEVGPARLGCRPATAIAWIHDNLYRALSAPAPSLGACGFCITGNSGGSSQSAYALSFYGLGDIVDAAVLSGGPPHAAIEPGCTGVPPYAYTKIEAPKLDLSYGFLGGTGPCQDRDGSFSSKWKRDSLDTGGGDYTFPHTRIVFIFGSADPTTGPAHGMAYLAKLQAVGTPYVSVETIPGMPHTIEIYPAGRAALETAFLGSVKG
jgi:hypothetical protein